MVHAPFAMERGARALRAVRADWLANAANLGGDIRVRLAERELTGTFETLDRMGRLMLRQSDGSLEAVTAGEVFAPRVRRRNGVMADQLVFAPLGGVGEIGMNLGALRARARAPSATWLIVDVGVAFAGEDLPGVDLIMPDVAFLKEQRRNIAGHRADACARGSFRRADGPLAAPRGARSTRRRSRLRCSKPSS